MVDCCVYATPSFIDEQRLRANGGVKATEIILNVLIIGHLAGNCHIYLETERFQPYFLMLVLLYWIPVRLSPRPT